MSQAWLYPSSLCPAVAAPWLLCPSSTPTLVRPSLLLARLVHQPVLHHLLMFSPNLVPRGQQSVCHQAPPPRSVTQSLFRQALQRDKGLGGCRGAEEDRVGRRAGLGQAALRVPSECLAQAAVALAEGLQGLVRGPRWAHRA